MDFFINGLKYGFHPLIDPIADEMIFCKNNYSAVSQTAVVSDLIQREMEKGYVIGPFRDDNVPYKVYRINPLTVAEGKYNKKKRLVLDLSAPHREDTPSINDLIDKETCSLKYVTIDNALKNWEKAHGCAR